MKKLVCMLAVVGMFAFTQANAQGFIKKSFEHLYGGPKVEANVSSYFLSEMPGVNSTMNVGMSAGGFLGYRISDHFAVQEDLLLNYKTSSLKQNGVEGDIENLSAEMSIYAMGTWNVGKNRIQIGVGPSVEMGIDGKYKVSGQPDIKLYKKGDNGKMPFQQFNVAAAITAGYEFHLVRIVLCHFET